MMAPAPALTKVSCCTSVEEEVETEGKGTSDEQQGSGGTGHGRPLVSRQVLHQQSQDRKPHLAFYMLITSSGRSGMGDFGECNMILS